MFRARTDADKRLENALYLDAKRLFSEQRLERYREELHELPNNDQLTQEAVWFSQNMLLSEREDMDDIIHAIEKIYQNRKQLL